MPSLLMRSFGARRRSALQSALRRFFPFLFLLTVFGCASSATRYVACHETTVDPISGAFLAPGTKYGRVVHDLGVVVGHETVGGKRYFLFQSEFHQKVVVVDRVNRRCGPVMQRLGFSSAHEPPPTRSQSEPQRRRH